ncbi:arsenite methyltransferase [Salinispira pacifica]
MSNSSIDVRPAVRDYYRRIAESDPRTASITESASCCGEGGGSCCSGGTAAAPPSDERTYPRDADVSSGYNAAELSGIPQESILGLGCGNPLRFSGIGEGEQVLDLGSGGGIDCFIAAGRVGAAGRVIGVDMTPEMVARARRAAQKDPQYANVEFRLGEIENLPVADSSVDLVISNCVINLSSDKRRVYGEIFRVLVPGGRIAISDMVAVHEIPADLRADPTAYASCISGAESAETVRSYLEQCGFEQVEVISAAASPGGNGGPDYVVSALIRARKPA